jgi:hypothetical protein
VEIIPAPSPPIIDTPVDVPFVPRYKIIQSPEGKFMKGTYGPGRPVGTPTHKTRFSQLMQDEAAQWIQEKGIEANPLMIAAMIAVDYAKSEPLIALKAAELLCRYMIPRVTELTGKDGGPICFSDREQEVHELAKDPVIRAMLEAAEERLGVRTDED